MTATNTDATVDTTGHTTGILEEDGAAAEEEAEADSVAGAAGAAATTMRALPREDLVSRAFHAGRTRSRLTSGGTTATKT